MLRAKTVTLILAASFAAAIVANARHNAAPAIQTPPVPRLLFTPFKASGIYAVGEKVGWDITRGSDEVTTGAQFQFVVRKNNLAVLASGPLDFSSGKATVSTSLDEPGMLYLEVTPQPGQGPNPPPGGRRPWVAGAAVAPSQLGPSVERPADFDAFWTEKLKLLAAISPNPVETPGESDNPDVAYSTIQMDHVNGTHVYGQLAKPNRAGKFPALLILQWASPPYPLQKPWVTGHAADGWLTLNIEPHDVLPTQPQSYYDALPAALKNYAAIGRDDRDKSYFLQMYLADYRAVEYLASRPDWDGKTLVVMGTSMGGQQSLCVAGLNPRVTQVIVEEPSGCDTNGPLHGRQAGYPFFPANDPKVMETALYFDTVNFAPRINARCLVAMGFVDTIAPPVGIWTAFNLIPGPKEAAPMVDAPHNNTATATQQLPYTTRASAWLASLVKGEPIR